MEAIRRLPRLFRRCIERGFFRIEILTKAAADKWRDPSSSEAIRHSRRDRQDGQRVRDPELKDRVIVDKHALSRLPEKRNAAFEEHTSSRLKLHAAAEPGSADMSGDRCSTQYCVKALPREERPGPDIPESAYSRSEACLGFLASWSRGYSRLYQFWIG